MCGKKDGLKMQNDPLHFVIYIDNCESETNKTFVVILIETNLKNRKPYAGKYQHQNEY